MEKAVKEIELLHHLDMYIKSDNIISFHGFTMREQSNYIEIYIVLDRADGNL